LLVLQAVVVALGALPLFFLARFRGLGAWVGLAIAVAYLLNPSIQAANWLEFHPVTLAPTLLIAAFYFLVVGRLGWFAVFAVLAASTKEEMGLLVAMMGVYAFFCLRRRRVGTMTFLLGAGWSFLAVFAIQPAFAGDNIHWGRYAYLGETVGAKVVTVVTRLDVIWRQLQQADVLRYFFELLLPVGFVALLALEVLFLALPSMVINLLADFAPMHQVTTLIYAAPIAAFVLLASVDGAKRLGNWSGRWARDSNSAAASRVTSHESRITSLLPALLILGGALVGQRLYGYLPGSGHYLALTVTEHHRRAQAIIEQIPAGARVAAQDRLNPHVAGRETAYLFPRVDDADTVFVDVTGPAWPQHPADLKAQLDGLLAGDFGVAAADDGYLLLSTQAITKELPAEFFTAWTEDPLLTAAGEGSTAGFAGFVSSDVIFGDELALRGYWVGVDRYGELVVKLVWEALRPLDRDLHTYVGYLDPELNVLHDSEFYPPPAALWYPTSLWTTGSPVVVQTLPWTLNADRFALAVGVYEGTDWASGSRLPVTSAGMGGDGELSSLPVLENGTLVRLGGYARAPDHTWQPVAPVAGSPGQGLDARFEGGLRLAGADLPQTVRRGTGIPITLQWQAEQPAGQDYQAFAHLLNEQGEKVAQLDWTPHDAVSKLPTAAWPAPWWGSDRQVLALPPEIPPGVYTLVAGLYDWQSGARVPVSGADARPDEAVTIGSIEVQ
jgi:uncharacterized membrane protein